MKTKRWQKAQEYERLYWMKSANKILDGSIGQFQWYEWKFKEMEKRLLPHLDRDRMESYRILEIGCGPIGIINYIKSGKRYGIDPLENFYRSDKILTKLRDSRIQYLFGTGEQIPFEEDFFNLIIIDNVLDHVSDTNAVMSEIFRVLRQGGLLYLTVNVRTPFGTRFHKILSNLLIDKGHPQSFDVRSIRNLTKKFQLLLLSEWFSDSSEARTKDMRSFSIKNKIKGYTGLSEYIYYAVCKK